MFGFEKKQKTIEKPNFYFSCVYNCLKDKCPLWITLTTTHVLEDKTIKKEMEGKCTFAWIPTLLIEVKDRIKG